jgi:hypothetical protein
MTFDEMQRKLDEFQMKHGRLPDKIELNPKDYAWFHDEGLRGKFPGIMYFNGIPVVRVTGIETR